MVTIAPSDATVRSSSTARIASMATIKGAAAKPYQQQRCVNEKEQDARIHRVPYIGVGAGSDDPMAVLGLNPYDWRGKSVFSQRPSRSGRGGSCH